MQKDARDENVITKEEQLSAKVKLKVQKEHDIRFPEGEEHLHFEGDVRENWMETIASLKHFQHL
jgi:hypothetical protein